MKLIRSKRGVQAPLSADRAGKKVNLVINLPPGSNYLCLPDVPGGYEDPADPVVLDDAPHGGDPLPLPGVGGVVVLRQLPRLGEDAGHGPAVPEVGHDHLAVLDEHTGGCTAQ